jgi:hypothetical protein
MDYRLLHTTPGLWETQHSIESTSGCLPKEHAALCLASWIWEHQHQWNKEGTMMDGDLDFNIIKITLFKRAYQELDQQQFFYGMVKTLRASTIYQLFNDDRSLIYFDDFDKEFLIADNTQPHLRLTTWP